MKKFICTIAFFFGIYPMLKSDCRLTFFNFTQVLAQSMGEEVPEVCGRTDRTFVRHDEPNDVYDVCSFTVYCETGSVIDGTPCHEELIYNPNPFEPDPEDDGPPDDNDPPGDPTNPPGDPTNPPGDPTNPPGDPPTTPPVNPPGDKNTSTKVYIVPCEGLRALWANSFNADGSIYKEAHGLLVYAPDGSSRFISFPMQNNTTTSSNFDGINFYVIDGYAHVTVDSVVYKVWGLVHTHPDSSATMFQGPSTYSSGSDDYSGIQQFTNLGVNNIGGYVISNSKIYNFGIDSYGNKTIFAEADRTTYFDNNCH